MPELRDRDDSEAAIAALIASIFNDQRKELKRKLGDPPKLAGITGQFWLDAERETARKLKPKLKEVHLAAELAWLDDVDVAEKEGQLNQQAAVVRAEEYAERQSSEVARKMTANTRERVEKVVRENAAATVAIGTGVVLFKILGAGRAEAISVTEVTNAVSRGELDVIPAFERQTGFTVEVFWQTRRDEKVCPICRPLQGRKLTDISISELGPRATRVYPGDNAHPVCRCFMIAEIRDRDGILISRIVIEP